MRTVTQDGMVAAQPGVGVSCESGMGKHILHVYRHYSNVKNEFGGIGQIKKLDCYGMEFPSSQAAFDYALDRGYLQPYYRKGR